MDVGTMTLQHDNGDVVLGLSRADLFAFATAEGVWLRFETEAGCQRGETSHSAEVGVRIPTLDLAPIVGRRLHVPRGYDPAAKQDPLATFDEYLDLDDNDLDILSQEGDKVHVHWAAVVRGLGQSGASSTRMEIDGRFTFRGVVPWDEP